MRGLNKAMVANILLLVAVIGMYFLPTYIIMFIYNVFGKFPREYTGVFSGVVSIVIFGGISFLYCYITKQKFFKAMSIKKISLYQICICILIGIGMYIGAMGINMISSWLFPIVQNDSQNLSEFIYGMSFWVGFMVVVITPAIFEELFFRGIFFDAYSNYNKKLKYILIALIFATFHGNVMQLIYVMFIGTVLIFVRDYTGSLVAAMILHGFNNGTSYVLSHAVKSMGDINDTINAVTNGQNANLSEVFTFKDVIVPAILWIGISLCIIYIGLRALKSYSSKKEEFYEINGYNKEGKEFNNSNSSNKDVDKSMKNVDETEQSVENKNVNRGILKTVKIRDKEEDIKHFSNISNIQITKSDERASLEKWQEEIRVSQEVRMNLAIQRQKFIEILSICLYFIIIAAFIISSYILH